MLTIICWPGNIKYINCLLWGNTSILLPCDVRKGMSLEEVCEKLGFEKNDVENEKSVLKNSNATFF